ncbi:2'-5' RNA ligase family protein [Halopenitus persicus]|uniref:2'-5' RNA ligase superfamily protein n=1 Tax=Halopenitus persicus TaxID=1048396 RepID=A0A1H3M2G7_9EURY|nr:2'-5' RNA ligase family protein [Halopenitus persicus]QHS18200.1 2'-5' RNA ligase family protein [haloarchaeon 3A1-DGR]SDY70766.1 2'-5' RNA ligase superfamily protein [Halopenitus persicus]
MFSLNVPLPPAVDRLANDRHPDLVAFDRVRERHTLVCKRFGSGDLEDVGGGLDGGGGGYGGDPDRGRRRDRAVTRLRERLRPVIAGTDPLDLSITGIDYFEEPARGPGPVVYLRVESDDLDRLHRRLCRAFDPVPGIEGEAYVPHVTLARGGPVDRAEALAESEIDRIEWRARSLTIYDPDFREPAGTVSLE